MKIRKWLREIFDAQDFNDLNIAAIGEAFNDPSIRSTWLMGLLEDLKLMNREVDRRLLGNGPEFGLTDLCARRKAYQDVLEAVLTAKRKVTAPEMRHNPRSVEVNLDRVTV